MAETMIDRLAHRGPDGSGLHSFADGTTDAHIAHRRLSIIDLSPAASQPFVKNGLVLSYNGELDTCICIRTVVVKDGVAHVQAGGGTVADAVPAYEFAESEAKARAVLRAVELASQQPDWP